MEQKFYIITDQSRMDLEFIHVYLFGQSYWAKGRSIERVKKSMSHSLCFGLFAGTRQIGFGRVATDYVVFAWIMDLFVDPLYRGKGLGRMLIQTIIEHPELQDVNSIGFRTQDAHELYKNMNLNPFHIPRLGC